MIAIHAYLVGHGYADNNDEHTRIPGIWSKLDELYDLRALDEREDAQDQILNPGLDDDEQSDEEVDEYEELVRAEKRAMELCRPFRLPMDQGLMKITIDVRDESLPPDVVPIESRETHTDDGTTFSSLKWRARFPTRDSGRRVSASSSSLLDPSVNNPSLPPDMSDSELSVSEDESEHDVHIPSNVEPESLVAESLEVSPQPPPQSKRPGRPKGSRNVSTASVPQPDKAKPQPTRRRSTRGLISASASGDEREKSAPVAKGRSVSRRSSSSSALPSSVGAGVRISSDKVTPEDRDSANDDNDEDDDDDKDDEDDEENEEENDEEAESDDQVGEDEEESESESEEQPSEDDPTPKKKKVNTSDKRRASTMSAKSSTKPNTTSNPTSKSTSKQKSTSKVQTQKNVKTKSARVSALEVEQASKSQATKGQVSKAQSKGKSSAAKNADGTTGQGRTRVSANGKKIGRPRKAK